MKGEACSYLKRIDQSVKLPFIGGGWGVKISEITINLIGSSKTSDIESIFISTSLPFPISDLQFCERKFVLGMSRLSCKNGKNHKY